MDIIFANDELMKISKEFSKIIFWGNGLLGKTVSSEILSINPNVRKLIWDINSDGKISYAPYTLCNNDDINEILVIICIGNRIVAEQKKKECMEKGFHVILALDYGYEDSITKLAALEFSLNMGCSLNCKYCPQDVLFRSYKEKISEKVQRHLTFDEFKRILSHELNPCATVSFSGMSEPFENPECADMIAYAYEHGFRVHINTTLMGLTKEAFEKIRYVKIERNYLHVPDEEGLSSFKITDEYIELLQEFITTFKDSIHHISVHSPNIDKRVESIVKNSGLPISDGSGFGDRAGNLEILNRHINKTGQLFCTQPGASYCANVVLPSGRLAVCCEDYSIHGVGGNILEQSWETIVSHRDYGKLRMGIENEEWLCKKCQMARPIEMTLKKYPDFPFEKMNCSYVYNIARNYISMIKEKYRDFFANPIYIAGLTNSKQSYYFMDNGWFEIFNVLAYIGENNPLGLDTMKGISYMPIDKCEDKNIPVLVMADDETEVEQLRKKGFSKVASFKEVALSYIE